MARKKREEHHENHDRWLVSYADFITLLFAFFVVMYSISSINEGKYRVLSDTLVAAFKTPPKSPTPIAIGKTASATSSFQKNSSPTYVHLPPTPGSVAENGLKDIAKRVESALAPLIKNNLVNVTRDKLWIKVEMDTSLLFRTGSAELQSRAIPTLESLAVELKTLPNHIDIEGHTDNVPIRNLVFPSNWELSAARAASVVHLFMDNGVDPSKLSAIGFGEHRPLADNTSLQGRRKNRRVVIVILADKNARRLSQIEEDQNSSSEQYGDGENAYNGDTEQ